MCAQWTGFYVIGFPPVFRSIGFDGAPCFNVGSIYEAVITRTSPYNYIVNMSIVEQGVVGVDECINVPANSVCLRATPLDERSLTPDELDTTLEAFQTVEIDYDSEPDCAEQEPCGITNFYWDSFFVNDYCAGPRLRSNTIQVIADLLGILRSNGQLADGPDSTLIAP